MLIRTTLLFTVLLAAPALACPPAPGQFAPNCVNNGDRVDGFGQFFRNDLSRPVPFTLFIPPGGRPTPPDAPVAAGTGAGPFANLWLSDSYPIELRGARGLDRGIRPFGFDDQRGTTGYAMAGSYFHIKDGAGRLQSAQRDAVRVGDTIYLHSGEAVGVVTGFVAGDFRVQFTPEFIRHASPGAATASAAPPTQIVRANGQTVTAAPPLVATPAVAPAPGQVIGAGSLVLTAGGVNTAVPVRIVRMPDGRTVAVDDQGAIRGTATPKAGGLAFDIMPTPAQAAPLVASAPPPSSGPSPRPVLPPPTDAVDVLTGPTRGFAGYTEGQTPDGGVQIGVNVLKDPYRPERGDKPPAAKGPYGGAYSGAVLQSHGARQQLKAAIQDGRVAGRVTAAGMEISPAGLAAARPYLEIIAVAEDLIARLPDLAAEQRNRGGVEPKPAIVQQVDLNRAEDDLLLQEGESIL